MCILPAVAGAVSELDQAWLGLRSSCMHETSLNIGCGPFSSRAGRQWQATGRIMYDFCYMCILAI